MGLTARHAALAAGIVALVLARPVWGAVPDLASPRAAAQAFYKVYGTTPRTGALPNATARTRYAPILSSRLDALLAAAVTAQARFSARVKGVVPPMIGGDLFTSNFDGATKWVVGQCMGDGTRARCVVALAFQKPGAKPVQWHDTLELIHASGGWKVDDIVYDPGFAAGNTGRLSQMLKMMVAQAPP